MELTLRRPITAARVSATLAFAASLAVSGDALLHEGLVGLALPIWVATASLGLVALAWRADLTVPRETLAWLGAAILLSSAVAWRDAEMLRAFDVLATAGACLFAAASLNRYAPLVLAPGFVSFVAGIVESAWHAATGFVVLATGQTQAARSSAWKARGTTAVRAALLSLAVIVVFGSILRDADPIFSSYVSLPSVDFENVLSHVVFTA